MTPSRPLLLAAFGALLAAATMQLCTPHAPPVSSPESLDVAALFTVSRDEGTICLPVMNRLHLGPCPMVLL